jgi:hypothetical protein
MIRGINGARRPGGPPFEQYDRPEYADLPEQIADLLIGYYGPTHRVYHALSPEQAIAFRKDPIDLYRGYFTPADGKVPWGREYIFLVGTVSTRHAW